MRFFSVNEYDMDTPFDASQGRKPAPEKKKQETAKAAWIQQIIPAAQS